MKLRYVTLLIFCLLSGVHAFAQSKDNVYFVKNSGTLVDKLEDADYIRVFSAPDSGSTFYKVTEYYKDNKIRFAGKSSKPDMVVYEGQCRHYYPSGKRMDMANYKNGLRDGDSYEFYKNGNLYLHKTYAAGKELAVIDCVDSTGKVLLANGNGIHIIYNNDFKDIIEQGPIKDGLKDGEWKGKAQFANNTLTFNEVYNAGKLVAGKSVDQDGANFSYTDRQVQPTFPGGIAGFSRFLTDVVRYPEWARKNRIEGRVLVGFMVQLDGTLGDLKVKESPDEQMSAEAIRVLKISPKWQPGVFYGKTVLVSYTVPIGFKLSRF